MRIGIPKEIKNNENRVGMTPAGVAELVHHGHQVFVQHTAGEGSGFTDDDYVKSGAEILPTIEETYAAADMIVKVKEPIEEEYPLVKKGQVVFTYFHFACDKPLTDAMIASGGVCIAYETVQLPDRSLPLLIPMSEVAGRMATINGAHYLQKTKGGKGKLICGVPGVRPAKVVVLGGGVVGQAAARVAAGMGAQVVITDISLPLLRRLTAEMPANVVPLYSNRHNIIRELKDADIVVRTRGCGHRPGWMLRDLETHYPLRPCLHRRWHRALCSGQYTGSRAQHVNHRAYQRHAALCIGLGR